MAKQLFIYRVGQPGKFRYEDSLGRPVGRETKVYADSLKIPPAWQAVEIAANPNAKLLATGYDAAGRKQYLYNPKFRRQRQRKNFDRLLAFANALPMMRRITSQHLRHRQLDRQKVLACMVRLIDQAYFRVGDDRYTRENETYGLTTIRSRHFRREGNRLIFEYTGKGHKIQRREVEDGLLAKIVAEIDELPGYEIFKYYDEAGKLVDVKSQDLNTYIKEVMGYDFSAKDFRTWAGTLIAAVVLSEMETGLPASKAKRNVAAAVRHVAEHLGNTPAIARASYIDPRVIDHYLTGTTIKNYLRRIGYYLKDPQKSQHFSPEEVAVLRLLKRKLKHQLDRS